ncbi:MAG: UDP-glucose 4-epimerase [Actinobacteria bacterium HGW-Actinobacteria-9]|nr:MAG: UDP-glucose 4-epimerase [Actinobacteria bacterium HGW-Actinobacteria-9]
MRMLVTGGAGFIGSNLVQALSPDRTGVLDDLSSGKRENLMPDVWFRQMDILDPGLSSAFAEFAPDVVVHLAAQPSVAESLRDPQRDWTVNVEGTRAVAQAAADAGARLMLSASSAAVYGDPVELPLLETTQKAPMSPYGRSKLAAESVIAEVLAGTRTDFASLRFANVYGPRQDAQGEGGVVAVFCSQIAAGRAPVIHGTGEQTRDFIFVGDIVGALLAAIAHEGPSLREGGGSGPAYNVSTGNRTSINRLARLLADKAGFTGEFEYAEEREGDIAHSVLNPRKARDQFAWDARADLERGLDMTYKWFRDRA